MSRNITYSCGDVPLSGCVLYTGEYPDFIDPDSLSCSPNLDQILQRYGTKIDEVLSSIDLSDLDKKCIDFDPATITVKGLHQKQIDKLCDLDEQLSAAQEVLDNLDIGALLVTIDLDCLTPVASPCAQGVNTYSLLSILQIFRAEICAIKEQLNP